MIARFFTSLLLAAILLLSIFIGSAATTRDSLNRLQSQGDALFVAPRKQASNFQEWQKQSQTALDELDRTLAGTWRDMVAYPGFRHDMQQLSTDYRAIADDYRQLIDDMAGLFAENQLLRKGWEKLMLQPEKKEISFMQLTDGVLSLVDNFSGSSEVLRRFQTFQPRYQAMDERQRDISRRLTLELGPMDRWISHFLIR